MDDESLDLSSLYTQHLQVLATRFDRALADCGFDGLIVHSGALSALFRDDQTHPFRADAWFKAWVPVTDTPDCFLYYEPGRKPLVLFHRPVDYWYKPSEPPQSYWTERVEVILVADRAAARAALPRNLGRIAYLGAPLPELALWEVSASNPAPLLSRLDYDRAVKTPYELECLRRANRLAARGHRAAARAFRQRASEYEIELAFLEACAAREQDLPYNPIIALNENGATLHYQRLERAAPAPMRSLLIDAGAESLGYASDVTRTHARAKSEFASLIERFDEVQQVLCSGVHAGVDWRDVHLSAHRLVAEFLHDAEIVHCDAEEAVATGVSSVFFPHGIGHLLGLQVHDVGGHLRSPEGGEIPRPEDHPYLRLTRVLEEGFVVTMEPGIYFIEQLLAQARGDARAARINWPRVASLACYGGIRIEDDLAVTANGAENLTRDAFRAVR
ncbi:MAG TPA: Xaa-Pro dipeptidase [Steroidobacteraceae bacterium]|nr:Xaa-Pro dipeptidase [Steroidobacteraceae bacterium]